MHGNKRYFSIEDEIIMDLENQIKIDYDFQKKDERIINEDVF